MACRICSAQKFSSPHEKRTSGMHRVGLNLLIFPPLLRCEEDVEFNIWEENNKAHGGSEAREAFL